MNRRLWTVRLWIRLMVEGYCSFRHPIRAWKIASDESFQIYRTDGLSPREAIVEDLSNL